MLTILAALTALWSQLRSSAIPTIEALLNGLLSGVGVPSGTAGSLLALVETLAENTIGKLGYDVAIEAEGKGMEAFINALPETTPTLQRQLMLVAIEQAWAAVDVLISNAKSAWWWAHVIVNDAEKASPSSSAAVASAQGDRDACRDYAKALRMLRENTPISSSPVLPTAPDAFNRMWAAYLAAAPAPATPGNAPAAPPPAPGVTTDHQVTFNTVAGGHAQFAAGSTVKVTLGVGDLTLTGTKQ